MAVRSRLNNAQSFLTSFNANDKWTAENCSIEIDGNSELYPGGDYKQVKMVLNQGASSCFLNLDIATLEPDDFFRPAIFLSAVKMESGGTVVATLQSVEESDPSISQTTLIVNSSTSVVNAEGVQSPQWNILRTNPLLLTVESGVPAVSVSLEFIPSELEENILFTLPLLYPQFEAITSNRAAQKILALTPEIFVEEDLSFTGSPDIPFMRFVDILSHTLDDTLSDVRGFAYLDVLEGFLESNDTTKSTLVNTSVASFESLVWLCKFSGTSPVTRFESSLDFVGEPFVLNSSQLNSTDLLRLTSFTELNPPAQDIQKQIELLRWELDNGYYGKNSGTLLAVQEAAKLMLVGEKELVTEYDFVAEPWTIHLFSPWDQTFGSIGEEVVGQSSVLVQEAIRNAKPLGVLVTHELTASNG